MDIGMARAQAGAEGFAVPRMASGPLIRRGRHAALVWFYADPGSVLAALNGALVPPDGTPAHAVLFAPGLPHLFRAASAADIDAWTAHETTRPAEASAEALLAEGVLELADDDRYLARGLNS